MQKLGFPSLNSLDQFKSLSGLARGATKSFSFASRSTSDSISSGSFANLKIAAENLMKEQASVKSDLDAANTKLKRSVEHVSALEKKLQEALNENAKLKVKQKEDEKLWKGLECKFSSTKTLCDKLTETLQNLASQVQDAEKDKQFFEDKFSKSSATIDGLNQQMNGLSLKMVAAENVISNHEREREELKFEKNEREKFFREEQSRTTHLIEQKDYMIKKFEEAVAANQLVIENLNSKMEGLQLELKSKAEEINYLLVAKESLEKEKSDVECHSHDITEKLNVSIMEIKKLENLVHVLVVQLAVVDRQSLTFLNKFKRLNFLSDSCCKLAKEERNLASQHAQNQYNQLHGRLLLITSERDALKLENEEQNNKMIESQKVHESVMAKISEEFRLAGKQIRKLESEVETLVTKKTETDLLVSQLEEKISNLSEGSKSDENRMQELLLKISALETENQQSTERSQIEMQKKAEQIDMLQTESEKYKQDVNMLEKENDRLHNDLKEKECLVLQYTEQEKKLEEQKIENQASLIAIESKLVEAKKQYDTMLEHKQTELSRHLKEISQKNDQAINDIRHRYEVEKLEAITKEKEKAEQVVKDTDRKFEQKLAECKEEAKQDLTHIQEEHASLVDRIQQECERKELSLEAGHCDKLKRVQLEAENELREKTVSLRNEHEAQMRALRCQHEDECKKLQEELDLQKSKEDRQRALLQLQWKVMSDKPQEDQEVNSKKEYSISSIKMRGSDGCRRSKRTLIRHENEEQDSPFMQSTQTPVSKLLKTVENVNPGSAISIPKHHKKVTHREYEVQTTNGRTITKRKKTRSTVLFEDPRKHKRLNTPKAGTPISTVKAIKGGDQPYPSNIGDLFTEGSLNPYADDPYAFD